MKNYYIQYNIGKVKYAISYHDGIQTHNDGSTFYRISCHKNLKTLNAKINQLKSEGYNERNYA